MASTYRASKSYKMIRAPESEYRRLRDAQRLLAAKGLDTVPWDLLKDEGPVSPPSTGDGSEAAPELTLGFVIGAGASALAYLIVKKEREWAKSKQTGARPKD